MSFANAGRLRKWILLRRKNMRIERNAKSLFVAMAIGCLLGTQAIAQDKPALTAEQAWEQLKKGNKQFVADQLEQKALGAERRQELAKGQHPFAIVLTCADSRVAPEFIFNQGLGDIFVL